MKHEKIARLLALVLTFCLIVGVLPLSAGAATIDDYTPLTIGQNVNSSIAQKEEEDVYCFTLSNSGTVNLEFTSYLEYYSLYLHDAEGKTLWQATNVHINETAGFLKNEYSISLESGTYYLEVTGKRYGNYNSTGAYSFETSFTDADVTETESNDTALYADEIEIGDIIRGQISVDNDDDFYVFNLVQPGAVTLDITSYLDYYSFYLLDESGTSLWSATNMGKNQTVGFREDTFVLHLEAGTYYLQATGKRYGNYNSTGNYTIETSFENANVTETEPNDSASEADSYTLGTTIRGQIHIDDEDFYKFNLSNDSTITVDITSYMEYYSLYLHDEQGKEVWSQTNKGYDNTVKFRHDVYEFELPAGTYYMETTGKRYGNYNGTGNYTLWIGVGTPDVEEPGEENPEDPTGLPFTDVRSGDYFYAPVQWAVEKNITSGTSATTFSPNQACTRAQAMMFLWKAAGQPEPTNTSNPFRDVKSTDYYYEAVLWAIENNITSGTGATTFSPNQSCTRGQIMTFLYKAAGSPSVSGSNPFRDVAYGDYFYRPVLWAVRNDITSGTSATAFSPSASCTRGQIVTFLYKHYA